MYSFAFRRTTLPHWVMACANIVICVGGFTALERTTRHRRARLPYPNTPPPSSPHSPPPSLNHYASPFAESTQTCECVRPVFGSNLPPPLLPRHSRAVRGGERLRREAEEGARMGARVPDSTHGTRVVTRRRAASPADRSCRWRGRALPARSERPRSRRHPAQTAS